MPESHPLLFRIQLEDEVPGTCLPRDGRRPAGTRSSPLGSILCSFASNLKMKYVERVFLEMDAGRPEPGAHHWAAQSVPHVLGYIKTVPQVQLAACISVASSGCTTYSRQSERQKKRRKSRCRSSHHTGGHPARPPVTTPRASASGTLTRPRNPHTLTRNMLPSPRSFAPGSACMSRRHGSAFIRVRRACFIAANSSSALPAPAEDLKNWDAEFVKIHQARSLTFFLLIPYVQLDSRLLSCCNQSPLCAYWILLICCFFQAILQVRGLWWLRPLLRYAPYFCRLIPPLTPTSMRLSLPVARTLCRRTKQAARLGRSTCRFFCLSRPLFCVASFYLFLVLIV